MSYESREQSLSTGEPIELYWFMQGAESFTYTSSAEPIEFEARIFEPVYGLTRSSVKGGSREQSRQQLTVDLPRDHVIAQKFVLTPEITPVWLYLYRIHDGETDFRVTWQGRVRFVGFKGNIATLTLDSILASTKRKSLRHLYQNQCNHFTFDQNCGLSEASFSHIETVQSIDLNVIEVNNAEAAGYFISGQVRRANGDRRFIVADTAASGVHTLTLLTAFEELEIGEEVTVIGGACRHTFDTCPAEVKENYGGFPKVPRKNPFKSFQ